MTQSTARTTMPMGTRRDFRPGRVSSPRLSGSKSNVYQPPKTPTSASSSIHLTRSATTSHLPNNYQYGGSVRKRSRMDYDDINSTHMEGWGVADPDDLDSPMPLATTKYILAGGIDTPMLAAAQEMEASEYSDVSYRRELDGRRVTGFPLHYDQSSQYEMASRSFIATESWGRAALEVVGEVVGKVWEFCKSVPFRGFHAGGGTGYSMKPSTQDKTDDFWEAADEQLSWEARERSSTPVPGHFPEEYLVFDASDREFTPPPNAKRRQIAAPSDDIAKNWVVVPPTKPKCSFSTTTPSRPQSPARYSMATSSSAGRKSAINRPASRASTAGSLAAVKRPMLQPRVSHAGSVNLQSSHGASFAGPRSPTTRTPTKTSATVTKSTPSMANNTCSPAAREAHKWAALKRKEERQADESIRRLDAQLKAMIKEGKEALGTKIEVDIQDDYGGSRSPRRWDI